MEINKETFTIKDLKQLLKEAFEFDYDKHKGKVKFFPLTIVEWHKSDVYKGQLSLDNIQGNILEWRRPFDCGGAYFYAQKTFAVFFQRTETIKLLERYDLTLDKLLVYFLTTIFHELQHYYQDILDELDEVNLFSYLVCQFVQKYNPQDYEDYHDEYWYEIDANLYGIERAYEFFKSKGMLTEEIEKILQEDKKQYLFDLNNFDIHLFFTEVHEIVQENPEIDIADYWFLNIFYDDSRRFRPIAEILELADDYEVGEEILNIFFSSKEFLDSFGFNSFSLSLEQKQIIMSAIEYALETEINRRKKNREILQNRQISSEIYLSYDARICSKIVYLNKKLEEFKRLMEIPIMNCNLDEETQDKRR